MKTVQLRVVLVLNKNCGSGQAD